MGGILLISHGRFAEGLKEAAEMLCGECPQLFTACLEVSDSRKHLRISLTARTKRRLLTERLQFSAI